MQGSCAAVIAFMLGMSACSNQSSHLTIGAKSSTESAVLAEIVAQQIEARSGKPVTRRTSVGSSALTYQALLMNEIDLYVENTAAVITALLKETPDKNPDIVLERSKGELDRVAHVQFIGPLGFEDPFVVVMRASDAQKRGLTTISEAAAIGRPGWNFASVTEFQERSDGNTALQSAYSLPLRSPPKILEPAGVYQALLDQQVDLVAGSDTDGALTKPEFVTLKDDKHAFTRSRIGVLARQDVITAHPDLRAQILELAGKLNLAIMRKMNAEVDIGRRAPKDVAADFLAGNIKP